MGSFILNYSDSRVREANNMLEKFKKDVKYFSINKSNIFGTDVGIFKVKNVTDKKSSLTNCKNVVIHCIGVQIKKPIYFSNESEKNTNTLIYGLKDFTFELTRFTENNIECANMNGINQLIDFFSEIDHIDEIKAQKCFEQFKNNVTDEINKNLL
jgi:hypothetical protein